MFTPKLNKPRSKFGSLGDNSAGSQSRKRSSAYTPQKSVYTPTGAKHSFNTSILQTSRVYEECGQHRLEAFGQSLPILVMESLALKDKHIEPSVKIDSNGWAWLVCGRRLLVWMFKAGISGKTPPCHELPLPPSPLPHSARLVSVTAPPGDPSSASCIAVTPEGAVRYWSNVGHEAGYTEISAELRGEEWAAVTQLRHSFVIASTSSSLMIVTPAPGVLRSRVLRPPQGMLTGISRRMSSFIFGGSTPQPMPSAFHGLKSGEELLEGQARPLYVLCGAFLQKWAVAADAEKMLYQCNVEQFVRDCFGHEIWHQDAAHLPKLKTWLLDLEVTPDGVLVLAAGVNTDVSNQMYYSIGMLHTEGPDSPRSFLSFNILKFTNPYSDEDEAGLLGYRLLLPDSASASIFLYEKKSILCTSVTATNQALDKLEFYAGNDKIIGAGDFDSEPVFFSSTRGLVSVKSTTAMLDDDGDDFGMDTDTNRMDLTSVAPPAGTLEELSSSEEETSRLKAAFLHSCRGNVGEAERLVAAIFPPGQPAPREPGSKLDRLVTQLSREMINDYPASDPRWAESHHSVGGSGSLILIHQLEDKLKAHEYLISFLKTIGLWEQLSSMPVRNTIMPTNLLLCEHAEKLVAARTLRELHTQHASLVDRAITDVLAHRDAQAPSSGLTAADVFYREVSKVHEILEALVDIEQQGVAGELSPRETVAMVTSVNAIIGNMLVDAVSYRQSKDSVFRAVSSRPLPQTQEYVAWTAADELEGPCRGARRVLLTQHDLTVTRAIPSAADHQERGELVQQLLELTGALLSGQCDRLTALKLSADQPTPQYRRLRERYEDERTRLIAPFLTLKQFERAASLAEKYQDFPTLVQICEETDNQDRLQRYMTQYATGGFADFVFKWYLDEGKRGKLMTSSLASHPQLHRFLQTGENKFMSWLQDIAINNFLGAHKTLYELGIEEKNSAAKKRTLLSLSKLAALATEDLPDAVHGNMEAIAEEQDLLLHQEQLPAEVLENIGFDADNMRVFTPKELIELYVGEYNNHSNEFDFKKALDLLAYVEKTDPDYSSLLVLIWSRAVLRDNWSQISPDDHLESCRDTVFFKTVELAHTAGVNLSEDLPPADTILSSVQLNHLKDDAHFQFLIKASFEQITRVLKL